MRNLIKLAVIWLIKLLVRIVPKKKGLWLFGAWKGFAYSDNSKAMFEYICTMHPEIQAVWITRDVQIYNELKNNGFKCEMRDSAKGFLCVLRAECAFETEGNQDISYLLSGTTVIQLWHGVAPKKADWWIREKRGLANIQKQITFSEHLKSFWMVASEQNRRTMMELIGMDEEQTFVTGYPRNDVFFMKKNTSDIVREISKEYPECKKIIYMPTHRNFGAECNLFSEEEMLYVDKKLRDNNVVMLFKPHFHEVKKYEHFESKLSNIILAKDQIKYADVYSYIGEFDLLISDYSSIIYDFLCTKKPIVLFPYDLEDFRKGDAGLFDYYEDVPVGPFAFNWQEVMDNVICLLDNDSWKDKREICRKMFHPFDDGMNKQRVFEATKQILSKQ